MFANKFIYKYYEWMLFIEVAGMDQYFCFNAK